jgi:hypothetical protein
MQSDLVHMWCSTTTPWEFDERTIENHEGRPSSAATTSQEIINLTTMLETVSFFDLVGPTLTHGKFHENLARYET